MIPVFAAPHAPKPLNIGLNIAVLHMASLLFRNGFDVSDTAPDTYEKLCEHMNATGRMCVWNGASDFTIFDDAEVNYAFRAWHDYCHWKFGHDFSPEGEAAACEAQVRHLIAVWGDSPQVSQWAAILRAEVNGQGDYMRLHGDFPVNQRGFVECYLRDPKAAMEGAWPAPTKVAA